MTFNIARRGLISGGMNRIACLLMSGLLTVTPAVAQEPTEPMPDDMRDGMSLLEEGTKLFLRGLANEMEPALKELAENMEPALRELLGMIDDFDAYHLPEVLPNGDIIIRRKTPPAPSPEDEIEI